MISRIERMAMLSLIFTRTTFLQTPPHQMHRPLLTKLASWSVLTKSFLFIVQKEEQTPSNEAFGCANAARPHSFLTSKEHFKLDHSCTITEYYIRPVDLSLTFV